MQLVGNGSLLLVSVEMAYLGFRIKHQLACFLAWIYVLGGGPIMFFQKLLGNCSMFYTFTIEVNMRTSEIYDISALETLLCSMTCFILVFYLYFKSAISC